MQFIGHIDKEKIKKYNLITTEVILTNERLNKHILIKHFNEYQLFKKYLKNTIENPDIILEDKKNKYTIIILKNILKLNKRIRIVVKLATFNDKLHPKNSIITLMQLNDRTWKQTLKNSGNIIFDKNIDKIE